ncbi:D-serine ammonia-lyase [Enterococcus mundtii]|uniref:D-serine ammonia-lyase n=1 Tax=Enterococcus mundtii TaxID=53346 RepID=UPI000BB562A9|nr:D-serine ammonia-lyase [Enterococcus mundtii]PJK24494.1 D-serine ammonia-lyase [Enterococcus mundtii]
MITMDDFLVNMQHYDEVVWLNPHFKKESNSSLNLVDIQDAANRLQRFAPYIELVFPETVQNKGIIESDLIEIPHMLSTLKKKESLEVHGKLFWKCDNNLPISGSIKARGGIYEVLKFAEKVALDSGNFSVNDNYSKLAENQFKELFSKYSIAVGSTGNLGLSIGIMGAKLGFSTTVHMSHDAKQWKKDLLRSKGVNVVEHHGDFSKAVAEGRKFAETDPLCHFVDDEGSKDLFLGYAVAALRLKNQFIKSKIEFSKEKPLFVYLPCGVGGSPGGVAFGLNKVFGENIKIIFVEPTHAPSMLLGLYTELNDKISVEDIGIDGRTAADGLAVGRSSRLVGKIIDPILFAETTVQDDRLYEYLALLADTESIFVEPSSAAGIASFVDVNKYLSKIDSSIKNGTHLIWGTGGNMVPKEEMSIYYNTGKKLLSK